jgi:hypothetical protein
MAGKTLTGIGEDESGRHELGADTSDPALDANKTPSVRPTDKMPMYVGPSTTPTVRSGSSGPSVDEDKVAEGLKKLRSLDEPLGPIPTTTQTPTMRDGMAPLNFPNPVGASSGTPTLKETPAVAHPTPVNPAAMAAAAAAELIRSRGTAHGHAIAAAAAGQHALPVPVDDRMKGTLLGHSLHLPDLPAVPSDENRAAEVRPVAPAVEPGGGALIRRTIPAEAALPGFSQGDSRFFDNQQETEEFEPVNRRGKMVVRGTIFLAVASVFVVAAVAWVHKSGAPSEAQAPSPAEDQGAPAPVAPAAPANAAQPAPGAPTAAPAAAAQAPAPAPAVAPPPPAPAAPPPPAPDEVPQVALDPAPAARPKLKHIVPGGKPVAAAPRAAKPAAAPQPKPAVTGKRSKDEDPDGTLPLTE